MIKILKENLIAIITLFVVSHASFGQVNICEDEQSHHPIDKELFRLRESLQNQAVDTILIYRHWIYTNGFNGYGKVFWKKNGEHYQFGLDFNKETGQIDITDTISVQSDSTVQFFFDHRIDTSKSNPEKQDMRMSHDGQHFVSMGLGAANHYCFTISNLLVQFNPNHKRVQWINLFKEDKAGAIHIDDVRTDAASKKKRLREQPDAEAR